VPVRPANGLPAGTAAGIQVASLSRSYGHVRAVADASLSVSAGELVALLGPSGSGKTTLLRMVAGFERPDAGSVQIGGRLVVGEGRWMEPEERRVGMVFQHGALFPHLTAAGNVGFGATSRRRRDELLGLVGLAGRSGAFPHELSGGERQRVALARALAADPAVVLLDEPFASLDAGLRESVRAEVAGILRAAGAAALLVTHDQAEAMSLADRVAVMRDGRIEQVGTPDEIYLHPRSRWVAEFVGEADVLPGTVAAGVVECELGRFPAQAGIDGPVDVVLRPEHVTLEHGSAVNGHVQATVLDHSSFGHDHLVQVRLSSGRVLRSRRLGFAPWRQGSTVRVSLEAPVSVLPLAGQSGESAR
jgi:iron(III) transport system ATP-binding protein